MSKKESDDETLREKQRIQTRTDELLGPGTYAELNEFDPSKGETQKPCPANPPKQGKKR